MADLNFEIVEFNPTIVELQKKVDDYKNLNIQDIEDENGYELVKKAQLDLRDTRVSIEKFGKSLRDGANAYAKKVIVEENKLIDIIKGTEKDLKAKRDAIDAEKEIERRRKILPDRKDELERHNILADDEKILAMTSDEFNKFVQDEREKILKAKEDELKEEAMRIVYNAREQKLKENGVSAGITPKDVILGFTNAEFEYYLNELIKEKNIIEEKAKKDAEDKFKKEQEEKERQQKFDKEQQEAIEKQAKEQLEKNEKYNNRLTENGCTKENRLEFFIGEEGNKKILYKKISTFNI